ncbi:radical SAM protein [bacterium]|nr:radical SAM protein [bacterium]
MIKYSNLFDCVRNLYAAPSYFGLVNTLPLRYFLELTYRCNLNCPYCYVGEDRIKKELSTEDWYGIINQLPKYSIATLVGGEPLLRLDFREIFSAVSKRLNGKVTVVSNGYLLNDEIIRLFDNNQLLLLSVSLDGFGKIHDENRNKKGLFECVVSNLDEVLKLNKRPKIDIKTIVLENNLDDLPKLYKYCTEKGFEFFSLSFLRSNNLKQNSVLRENLTSEFFEENNHPLYFDLEHFKEIYKEIESIRKRSKCEIRFSPKFDYSKNIIEKIEDFYTTKKDFKNLYKACTFPFSDTFITPEGLVYPCLSVKMGDLKKNSLKEIYGMPCYREFRKKIKKEGYLPCCDMCCELCVE